MIEEEEEVFNTEEIKLAHGEVIAGASVGADFLSPIWINFLIVDIDNLATK